MRDSEEEEDKFAQEWRKAFEDAELPPSPVVWSEIENRLDKGTGWYRWRNVFLKKSILLPLLLLMPVAYFVWYVPQQYQTNLPKATDTRNQTHKTSSQKSRKQYTTQNNNAQVPKNQELSNQSEQTKPTSQNAQSTLQAQHSSQSYRLVVSSNTEDSLGLADPAVFQQPIAGQEKEIKGNAFQPSSNQPQITNEGFAKLVQLQHLDKKLLNRQYYVHQLEYRTNHLDTAFFMACQKNAATPHISRLSIEVAFSPVITDLNQNFDYQNYLKDYLQLHNIQNVTIDDFFVDLEEQTQYKSAFSVSARLVYAPKARLKLRTGVVYHSLQTTLQTNAIFVNEQNEQIFSLSNQLNSGSMGDVNIARTITTNSNYNPNVYHTISLNNYNEAKSIVLEQSTQYLKIPFEIGDSFSLGRNFSHTLWAGLSLDVLLGSTTHQAEQNMPSTKVNTHKKLNTSFSLRWQGNYHLNKKWTLFVEPFYERGIGNYAKSGSYLRISPQNYGVGMGINLKL